LPLSLVWYTVAVVMVTSPGPVSQVGGRLLAQLDRRRQHVLRVPDDLVLIQDLVGDRGKARALVQRLTTTGWLRRVRRGTYVVRSRSTTVDVSAIDLIGELSPAQHLVTAGRALAIHGLSDQSFRRTVVLVAVGVRDWEWLGEAVQYTVVKAGDIWGGRPKGETRRPTLVASPERAILDSLAHPTWGVSHSQAVRALRTALDRLGFSERLSRAAARYDNDAIARRLGFLTERLAGSTAAAPFLALRGSGHSVTPLRIGGPSVGAIDSKWLVRVNVDMDLLLESAT
jgi:predicted transcriptional regulator of viral defense system